MKNNLKSLSVSDYSIGERIELGDDQGTNFVFWIHSIDYSKNELVLRNPFYQAIYNPIDDECKLPIKMWGGKLFNEICTICN